MQGGRIDDRDVTAKALDEDRIVGRDTIELVTRRQSPLDDLVFVEADGADPLAVRRRRPPAIDRSEEVFDRSDLRPSRVHLQRFAGDGVEMNMCVREPGQHRRASQIDGAIGGGGLVRATRPRDLSVMDDKGLDWRVIVRGPVDPTIDDLQGRQGVLHLARFSNSAAAGRIICCSRPSPAERQRSEAPCSRACRSPSSPLADRRSAGCDVCPDRSRPVRVGSPIACP